MTMIHKSLTSGIPNGSQTRNIIRQIVCQMGDMVAVGTWVPRAEVIKRKGKVQQLRMTAGLST